MRSSIHSVIFLLFVLCFSAISPAQTRSGKFGIGLGADGTSFMGDASSASTLGYGGSLSLFYSLTPGLGLRSNAGVEQLGYNNSRSVTSDLIYGDLCLSADFLPNGSVNPFVYIGGGLAMADSGGVIGAGGVGLDTHLMGGIGMDCFLNEFWSITIKGEYVLTGSPRYTLPAISGNSNSFARVGLELRYYFFDQSFITKMLEALKDRYKKK